MGTDMDSTSSAPLPTVVSAANLKGGRQRSTSNVSATFPSSHDAFGLSASPSAPSNLPSARATSFVPGPSRSTQISPSVLASGPNHPAANGYGLFGVPPSAVTSQPPSLVHHGEGPPHSSNGSQFAHGVLPMNLDPGVRLNKPSALSQAWAGDDADGQVSDDRQPTPTLGSSKTHSRPPYGEGAGHMTVDVNRWRNGLEPSPALRRTSSVIASGFPCVDTNVPSPGIILSPFRFPSSGSQGSSHFRRASSDHLGSTPTQPVDEGHPSNSGSGIDGTDVRMAEDSGDGSGVGSGSATPAQSDMGNLATPPRLPKTPVERKGKSRSLIGAVPYSNEDKNGSEAAPNGPGGRRRSSLMEAGGKMKLLPPSLRKALAAENNLQMGEIRSEALLQNLILSNSSSLPMTPRAARHGQNRMLNSFPESDNESDSDDRREDEDSSDEEGPFLADDVGGPDRDGNMGMDVDAVMSSPFAFDPVISSSGSGNRGSARNTFTGPASTQRAYKTGGSSRRNMASRGSMQSSSSVIGGHVGSDDFGEHAFGLAHRSTEPHNPANTTLEAHNGKASSTAWRESPVASGKSTKRKAAFDDGRFEPYSKRYRAAHEPMSAWAAGLPTSTTVPIPTSPFGQASWDGADLSSRPIVGLARSRAGSPATPTTQTSSKLAVSPHNIPTAPFPSGNQGAPSHFGSAYRQNVGMGGLGMLLMSKRQANGHGTGTGLTGTAGEEAVAAAIGGMDVGTSEEHNTCDPAQEDDDDKMVFD